MSVLKLFFAAIMFVLLTSQTAFSNEESDAHNAKGVQYFNNAKNSQDYQKALEEYTAAIKIDANDDNISSYYSNRGSTYYKLGNYAAALEDLNKSLDLNGNNVFGYYWRALTYEAQKNFDAAKKDYIITGNIDYNNGNYEPALKRYTSAINIDDKNPEYYVNRGWTYYQLQKYDDAKKDFDTAIRLDGNYARAYAGRANLYKTQEQIADAVKDFVNAGKFYNRQALNADDIKKKDDLFNSARNMLNAAIESDKNCAEAYYRLGLLEYNISNYQESLKHYDKAIELKISNDLLDDTYARRGWSNYRLKNYDDAVKDFEKALDTDVANTLAYEGRAKTYYDSTDYANALADFNMLVKLDESKAKQYEGSIKKCIAIVGPQDDESPTPAPKPTDNFLEKFLGELDLLMKVLIVVMILAYVLEIWRKKQNGILTPKVAFQELFLRIIFVLLIAIGAAIDEKKLIGIHLSDIVAALVLLTEFGVVLQRAKEDLEVPIPDWLINSNNAIRTKIKGVLGIT